MEPTVTGTGAKLMALTASKRYENMNTVRFENIVQPWPMSGVPLLKKHWDRTLDILTAITEATPAQLEAAYGKRAGTWDGEYRFSLWFVEKDGVTFVILANREKGNSIEIDMTGTNYRNQYPEAVKKLVKEFVTEHVRKMGYDGPVPK